MSTVKQFQDLVTSKGSVVRIHRESGGNDCPCRTPEGFRDPIWHRMNPSAPKCNEEGKLAVVVTDFAVKGFVQPIQSTRATRLQTERILELVGEVQADDHLAILPVEYDGNTVSFDNFSDSGDDYVVYNGRRFAVVNVNLIPDPADGNPYHHYEIGLRLMSNEAARLP